VYSSNSVFPSTTRLVLTNIHPLGLEILPRLHYLTLQLRIRIGDIVEREDAPAELEQKVCAKGDKCPERNLMNGQPGLSTWGCQIKRTYGTTSF
jgi:hypothetical protein